MVLTFCMSAFIYNLIWFEFWMLAYFVFSCWSYGIFQNYNYAWKADRVLDD